MKMSKLLDAQIAVAEEQGFCVDNISLGGWYMDTLISEVIAPNVEVTVGELVEYRGIKIVSVEAEICRVGYKLV